ncbi:MAG: TraB/VirB10 family protein [Sphingomonas sp.]|nr:TraB/VirB10 family protein [Sphingomonas sp.]
MTDRNDRQMPQEETPLPAPRPDDGQRNQGISERPALLDIGKQWSRLSSGQQLRIKQVGVAASVTLLGYALYSASSIGNQAPVEAPQASNLDMGAGLRGDSLEVKLRADLQKILDGQSLLGDRITAIEEGKVTPGAMTEPASDAGGDGGALPPALPSDIPPYPPAPGGADTAEGTLPPPPSVPVAPPAPPTERQLGAIGAAVATALPEGGAAGAAGRKKANRTIYLPPGFMKARLLTGIDALASRDATTNPEPIMARVQAPAVLPNDVKANLAGCFVIGNATGSLAKERVEIQLVSISCIDFEEHAVVDQPIKGFFVDADGKKGLSGKVVTRVGATLARSFIAGTIAGFAQSVEGSFGDVSTSALGNVRSLDAADAVKTGVAGGLGRSSDKITEFYLDLARQAGPVVEVGAAKEVVVVIQEGLALEIKPTVGSKF